MLQAVVEYVRGTYDKHGTLYRLTWTTLQLGAGAAVVAFGADPKVGLLVTLLATAITSVARENLRKKSAA